MWVGVDPSRIGMPCHERVRYASRCYGINSNRDNNLVNYPRMLVLVHGPILILVPIRGTKDDCCELIAHKVEIENLYDNLSVGVAFKIFFSCKSAGNDL